MKALLVRRPGWGVDYGKVVNLISSTIKSVKVSSAYKYTDVATHIINWGHNNLEWSPHLTTLNKREHVASSSNKGRFRMKVQEAHPDIVPNTTTNIRNPYTLPCIVRPNRHMQGQNLHYCETNEEVVDAVRQCGPHYYISEYIPKVAEYRVYIVAGKVFAVSQKVVEDPDAIAWNHAGGECEFVNVRWDDWPIPVVSAACNAFELSGLDFGGVDVMATGDGSAYVLEINSALSLPMLEDDGAFIENISYHQESMTKCLEWLVDRKDPDYSQIYGGDRQNSYHQYIHAAMKA